ncbi:MAG: hypothetical protein V7629_13450 [Motiliproteus sp.]
MAQGLGADEILFGPEKLRGMMTGIYKAILMQQLQAVMKGVEGVAFGFTN